jgi:hypothetical protein
LGPNYEANFNTASRGISTPLKNLCLSLVDFRPEFLAQLMKVPTALTRFEPDDRSCWSEPAMDDVGLWIDALRRHRLSLERLVLQPEFRRTRPIVLNEFSALKYLKINVDFLFAYLT